ncbi:hypothetical protein LEN26_019902 [Aphanomyces euteiches]|nr:hypothetical protein LEN26_019902 [Aphanomyces euteiches]KAH9106857.1 hypothetical protein AeMF1_017636 [Aphanomyces euteiches]KAH9187601.1 hypothetical protein AeNC1_010423 [Aphanomyces euteiches]
MSASPPKDSALYAALHGGCHAAPGHFNYHSTPDPSSIFEHFQRTAATWQEFEQAIRAMPRKVKVLYFLRHAEGEHNAAKIRLGAEVWFRDVACTDQYLDALLTTKGQAAAESASLKVQAELQNGMPLEKVIVSPLRRTLQTATTVFSHQIGRIPLVSMELCRETMGMHTCDKRSPISVIKPLFPSVDFSLIQDDQDVLWRPDVRESLDDIQARAVTFLKQVYHDVPETFIAVTSHVGFIGACFRVLELPEYRVSNCEIVPFVLELPK